MAGVSGERRTAPPPLPRILATYYLLFHFLYFATGGLASRWADDDPMNLYTYWRSGIEKVLVSNLLFFDGSYRPLGGLFYLPLYAIAGLHPIPYRVVIFLLLAFNVWLTYRLARLLEGNETAAWFAAIVVSAHGCMTELVYMTSTVYDILCFTFLLSALCTYVAFRQQGRLRASQAAIVAFLFIAALNAKEMAAAFPLMIAAYEIIYQGRGRWMIGPAVAAAAIAALALYGKTHGPESLTSNSAYQPVISASKWLASNVSFTSQLMYARETLPAPAPVLLWLAMLSYALWRRRAVLLFAWIFIFVASLPISFINQRGGYCLYIPLAGWAIYMATLAADALALIRPNRVRWVAATLAAVAYSTVASLSFVDAGKHWRLAQAPTWALIQAFDALKLQPAAGSRLLIVDSPFEGYDAVFLAQLHFNDHSLEVADAHYATEKQWDRYDYVLRYASGKLEVASRPNASQ